MTDENTPNTPEEAGQSDAAQAAQQDAPSFAIQRVYLKDLSFETPMGIEALLKVNANSPKIQQDLNVQVTQLNEELVEVVLLLTITATVESRTLFLVEVKQAGLFIIKGFERNQFAQVINTACPQILFPYAREAIDGVLNRGGFPSLLLPPINFDAVFVQAVQVARQQAAESASAEAPVN